MRPCLEKSHHKKRAGGVAQGVGPEFKLQYNNNNKKTTLIFLLKTKNLTYKSL
jgi:hypothetical protein